MFALSTIREGGYELFICGDLLLGRVHRIVSQEYMDRLHTLVDVLRQKLEESQSHPSIYGGSQSELHLLLPLLYINALELKFFRDGPKVGEKFEQVWLPPPYLFAVAPVFSTSVFYVTISPLAF